MHQRHEAHGQKRRLDKSFGRLVDLHELLCVARFAERNDHPATVFQLIEQGGGRIEGYPEDIEGRKASPAFLFNR